MGCRSHVSSAIGMRSWLMSRLTSAFLALAPRFVVFADGLREPPLGVSSPAFFSVMGAKIISFYVSTKSFCRFFFVFHYQARFDRSQNEPLLHPLPRGGTRGRGSHMASWRMDREGPCRRLLMAGAGHTVEGRDPKRHQTIIFLKNICSFQSYWLTLSTPAAEDRCAS